MTVCNYTQLAISFVNQLLTIKSPFFVVLKCFHFPPKKKGFSKLLLKQEICKGGLVQVRANHHQAHINCQAKTEEGRKLKWA